MSGVWLDEGHEPGTNCGFPVCSTGTQVAELSHYPSDSASASIWSQT